VAIIKTKNKINNQPINLFFVIWFWQKQHDQTTQNNNKEQNSNQLSTHHATMSHNESHPGTRLGQGTEKQNNSSKAKCGLKLTKQYRTKQNNQPPTCHMEMNCVLRQAMIKNKTNNQLTMLGKYNKVGRRII